MNLKELKDAVDFALDHGCDGSEEVRITLSGPTVGARASANVQSANLGFDWEYGQFRIEPAVSLRADGRTLEDPLETICAEYIYDKRREIVHHCPNCGNIVKKTHKYCSTCGQKITPGTRMLFSKDYRTKSE